MRWLWVSRRAYDLAVEERDHLRGQVDKLLDHRARMDRVEHGVAETPRKPKAPSQEMPKSLVDYFDGLGNASMGKHLRKEAERMHSAGESWLSIQSKILEKIDVDAKR